MFKKLVNRVEVILGPQFIARLKFCLLKAINLIMLFLNA